jgi:GT2 family glycosyltransferase
VLRCLSALARQTYRDFRVVVIDNASSDGSDARIESQFPGVKLVRAGANVGFARGNNIGFGHAEGSEFVVLLNPDAFAEREWLEKLVEAAGQHPDCASIGSRLLRADDPLTLDGIGDVYHVSGVHWREGFGKPLAPWSLVGKEIFSPCAASALYRLSAIRAVGGFDEDYFCYSEDVDLGFRLRLAGYRSWYAPDSVVHHVSRVSEYDLDVRQEHARTALLGIVARAPLRGRHAFLQARLARPRGRGLSRLPRCRSGLGYGLAQAPCYPVRTPGGPRGRLASLEQGAAGVPALAPAQLRL